MKLLITLFILLAPLLAQEEPAPPTQNQAPVMVTIDGESGPCSVEFLVTTAEGEPVRAARIQVKIDKGFFGFGKLELEAFTNREGRVRFIGMPKKVNDPLYFEAVKGDLFGVAFYNPKVKCNAEHAILMGKRLPPPPAAQEEEDED